MKNPHLHNGNWKTLNPTEVSTSKKFKRKAREPVKRISEDKSYKYDHKIDENSLADLMEDTFENNSQQRLSDLGSNISSGVRIGPLENTNTALDMRINTLPTMTGKLKDKIHSSFPQVTGFDNQQAFTPDPTSQSRIVMCQRSERSLSSASQASCINNSGDPAESPRKRPGEPSGVVTEIKAIQQTRRLLANARERTRVHTISAAFEALRKQVPCYSYGQKLSKLAILRIACNYILSLAQLADLDYTPDHSNMSFRECVEQCTRTLQAEGRSKKRKE
ncbi:transcription factor atoh8 [Chanos chanos]|uniref:Protein atonal homolog 8 n=1 Tax=Chanos chanos TaxID=29144 RepID=A0A6J2UMK5_CHACN|nr:protein atonal homolog 8 [Chanos chanos]